MSFLSRSVIPVRASALSALSKPTTATSLFHTSAVRSALSESDRAQDHPERASNIDRHKHDSVSRAQKGAGEWKPELASNSEQSVKGDKHDMSMDEMQKLGEKKAEEGREPSGSSSNKV